MAQALPQPGPLKSKFFMWRTEPSSGSWSAQLGKGNTQQRGQGGSSVFPGAVGMLQVPSWCPVDGGRRFRAAFGRDSSRDLLAGAHPSPQEQSIRGYPTRSPPRARCPTGSSAAGIPLLRLQMFVQGPRDRCDSSPEWNQRFAVSLHKSQLSLDGSDPRSSSPALCWFGWIFPAVQTQIPGPAGIPCSPLFQRHRGRQECTLP